ncbi:hypothetical protein Micbo1qcDRAFT_159988 [Microdochium bolleyi]|uniref:Uncharacterized protein n=1 Tax=Microdochium bolleyi TaxID=196109 RepID=A0A136JC24_9PEZI|nr:hypothetical protein Micbo1qcDRAFT_159988 [Microdochium bolleyi]
MVTPWQTMSIYKCAVCAILPFPLTELVSLVVFTFEATFRRNLSQICYVRALATIYSDFRYQSRYGATS